MKKPFAALATIAALVLATSSCNTGDSGGPGGQADSPRGVASHTSDARPGDGKFPQQPSIIRISPTGPFTSFDPLQTAVAAIAYLAPVYEGLVGIGQDGSVVPVLADHYEVDGLTYTFSIREGVKFSDGSDLNAAVVAANLERGQQTPGPNSATFSGIKTIATPDDYTVVVTLAAPQPAFLLDLSNAGGMIVAQSALTSADVDRNPVGTGAWIYNKSESQPTKVVFDRNDHYWGGDVSSLAKKIEVDQFDDPAARVNAVESGQVDLAQVSGSMIPQLKSAGHQVDILPSNRGLGLMIMDRDGHSEAALGDARVRQALQLAIDRDAFVKALFPGGDAAPAAQLFPDDSFAHVDGLDDKWKYDPDRAKELLKEAGYPNGFSFTVPVTPYFAAYSQAIAGYFADIGVTMNLENITTNLPPALATGKYQGVVTLMPYEDPDTFRTGLFDINSVYNVFKANDPQLTQLGDTAAQLSFDDPNARAAAYQAYYERVIDEGYVIVAAQILPAVAASDHITSYVWPSQIATPLLFSISGS